MLWNGNQWTRVVWILSITLNLLLWGMEAFLPAPSLRWRLPSLSICRSRDTTGSSLAKFRTNTLLSPSSRTNVIRFLQEGSKSSGKDDDDDEEDEDDEDTTADEEEDPFDFFKKSNLQRRAERMRKRDVLRDWFANAGSSSNSGSTSTSGSKSMVRPIRMEDGSIVDPPPSEPNRVQAKFDSLFKGMPSIGDILGVGADEDEDDSGGAELGQFGKKQQQRQQQGDTEASNSGQKNTDDSWFDEERKEIEAKYEEIWQEIASQLQQEREEDPESVPQNAEGVMKTVLLQELEAEIEQKREERARSRLEVYEEELFANLGSRVPDEANDETVQKLMEESEAEYEKWENSRIELDEFIRYEQEAFQRAQTDPVDIVAPEEDEDLDQWALDRLKEMASARQVEDTEDKSVLSILEDNIEELQAKLTDKQQSKRRTTNVDDMSSREWQMYRSIATRFEKNEDASTSNDAMDITPPYSDEEKEGLIADRLQSWKEFEEKEEQSRKEAGLARGPRLPFEWQEMQSDENLDFVESGAGDGVRRSQADIRRDINRKAVEALEELVSKGGSVRNDSLKRDLEALKAQLASQDYLDVDERELEDDDDDETNKNVVPVDISDVFSNRYDDDDEDNTPKLRAPQTAEIPSSPQESTFTPPKPLTPFFQDEEEDTYKPPPPQTPFFDNNVELGETAAEDSKLGSLEVQKLRSMYRRANAQTPEEQAQIRKQWEEYQEIEKMKRAQVGLGVGADDDTDDNVMPMGAADLKVNISAVMKDGDFDAEQILAAIGPRPKRQKSTTTATTTTSAVETPGKRDVGSLQKQKEPDPDEISDALFRAVAATGGGTTRDDPLEKEKERKAYEEFLRKENELRQRLDEVEEEVASELPQNMDDVEYANKVLQSLGPRPTPKHKRAVDIEEFSDNGGVLADTDDDDEDDEDEEDEDEEDFLEAGVAENLDMLPNWLKKERDEARKKGASDDDRVSRTDINDAFDDDEYEKNMRQLAEYERRRSAGRKRSPGIDISDLFLNRDESDDYRDYGFEDYYAKGKTRGSSFSSFDSRKANLLEYTELNVQELNSLMDHRESVYATGVSQYLPRINKPFKEFGAIFRLEGVLIDITGFQLEAYKRVAEKHGFRQPDIEDVRRAAVTRSDFAIREIFYWTDDILLCRDAAATHRQVLREVIADWIEKMGLQPKPSTETTESSSGAKESPGDQQQPQGPAQQDSPRSEDDLVRLLMKAWTHTAKQYGLQPPSIEAIASAATVGPDVAVRAFGWSKDTREIDRIVSSYRRNLELVKAGRELNLVTQNEVEVVTEVTKPRKQEPNEQDRMMEMIYLAWTKTASDKGFEPPTPEEVMAAIVINDPVLVVRDGFGWTDDRSTLSDTVQAFQKNLADLMNAHSNGELKISLPDAVNEPSTPQGSQHSAKSSSGPTDDEILEMYVYAWTVAAEKHGYESPALEQIQLASKTDSKEAIRRLFGWAKDDDKVNEVATTFNAAMKKVSEKYIQKYKLKAEAAPSASSTQSKTPTKQTPSDDEIFKAAFDAWTAVARKSGFQLPDYEQVQFAMTVGPEEAIVVGFEWTADPLEAEKIAQLYKDAVSTQRSKWQSVGTNASSNTAHTQTKAETEKEDAEVPPCKVIPGVAKWVKSLLDNEMQCGVMSYLERDQVDALLEYAGLSNLFDRDKIVTRSSGYSRERQQMLGVALRIERRPDHCVVFDASPYAAAEAHDVEMKNVAMIGNYPRYELLASDLTASSCDELTALNLRRLFGERVDDQPMFDMQQTQPETRKKIRTRFWEEGDRI